MINIDDTKEYDPTNNIEEVNIDEDNNDQLSDDHVDDGENVENDNNELHDKEVEICADDSKKVMKTSQYVFEFNKVLDIYTLFELQSPTYQ